jgi:hypothetical protein
MPPRIITLGIVALWLVAVGWGAYRVWGREPGPPPLLDRTDEVGKQTARWVVYLKGNAVGHVQTRVGHMSRGPLFTLHANVTFGEVFRHRGLPLMELKSTYRVTPRGQLRQLNCSIKLGHHETVLEGRCEDEGFWATVRRDHAVACEQVRTNQPVGVLDLLHPPHRLTGLHEGRQWPALAIDPLEMALDRPVEKAREENAEGPKEWCFSLTATAAADRLTWGGRELPCWRVDFREGDGLRARVWARRGDGLVLRHEAAAGGEWFDVRREIDHAPTGRMPRVRRMRLPGLGR